MNDYSAAASRASEVVDVPGAPRSLRLDDIETTGVDLRLSWSFVDPQRLAGDLRPAVRRITGQTDARLTGADPDEFAQTAWGEAQLAAARRYKKQIDADWIPGEPAVRATWTTDMAWQALLTHLRSYDGQVHVRGGEIRVIDGTQETVFRIDPDEWAAYLSDAGASAGEDHDIVPAVTPLVDGLPLWVVDELMETAGSAGPVVGLVAGRLVGLRDHGEAER